MLQLSQLPEMTSTKQNSFHFHSMLHQTLHTVTSLLGNPKDKKDDFEKSEIYWLNKLIHENSLFPTIRRPSKIRKCIL